MAATLARLINFPLILPPAKTAVNLHNGTCCNTKKAPINHSMFINTKQLIGALKKTESTPLRIHRRRQTRQAMGAAVRFRKIHTITATPHRAHMMPRGRPKLFTLFHNHIPPSKCLPMLLPTLLPPHPNPIHIPINKIPPKNPVMQFLGIQKKVSTAHRL